MRPRRSILTAGFVAIDAVRRDGAVAHTAGGTAANVAAILSHLGWDTGVLGVVGRDPAGTFLRSDLRRRGVRVSNLLADPRVSTPVVIHDVLDSGHRFSFRCPECGRPLPRAWPLPTGTAASFLARPQHVATFAFDRANTGTITVATELRRRGALVVFEPSTPGRDGLAREAASIAHILKYSIERSRHLPDPLLEARPGQLQVRTRGAGGVDYRYGRRQWTHLPAAPTLVVDAAGAGDWMTAGLIASLRGSVAARLSSSAARRALDRAQVLAALSCGFPGALGLASLTPDQIRARARRASTYPPVVLGSVGAAPGRTRQRRSCPVCLSPRP
jgi:fructokinase